MRMASTPAVQILLECQILHFKMETEAQAVIFRLGFSEQGEAQMHMIWTL
jgi:hypothetical protein